jgi:AcrR family transcriptional regulator
MTASLVDLLDAALDVFRAHGYGGTTLEQVALQASVDLASVQAQFADTGSLFSALLAKHSPINDLEAAIDAVEGDTADEILRDAMRRLVKALDENRAFLDLAAIDVHANNGAFLGSLGLQLLPKMLVLRGRLKKTGQLRPVSDFILARTLVAMLMGFVLSEQVVPQIARTAMRFLPQRGWIDGMVDLLLYGVLEDDAR